MKFQVCVDLPEDPIARPVLAWPCPFCPPERDLTFYEYSDLGLLMARAADHIGTEHSSAGGPSFT